MISKSLPTRSFYHTCRYIVTKPGSEVLYTDGVRDYDYRLMADDFEAQRQMRPTRTLACFHSILSFPHGEIPDNGTMEKIAREYLKRLGFGETQSAACKHTDRGHIHLHLVANMVGNDGNAISDSWIGLKGKKVAQQLAKEFGLQEVQGKNLKETNLEALNGFEAARYKIYIAIAERLPQCRTLEELERSLEKIGIETVYKMKGQTDEKQGVSFKIGEYSFKGSKVDRQFSLGNLIKTLATRQTQEINRLATPTTQPEKIREERMPPKQIQGKPTNPANENDKVVAKEERDMGSKGQQPMQDTKPENSHSIIERLLEVENTFNPVPYDISQKGHGKKKKKKRRLGL
jgi:hypothetical protein